MAKEITITCPCCNASLRVDVHTGKAYKEIRSKKKKKGEKDEGPDAFDQALSSVTGSAKDQQDQFLKALDDESHRAEHLEDAFRKAREEADDSDEPPPNPFDFD